MSEQNESGRKQVTMEEFITVWEQEAANGGNAETVAEKLGLEPTSVTARASSYRNPPRKKKVRKMDENGKPVKDENGKFVMVSVDIPENERREPIPLSFMKKGNKLNSSEGAALVAQLREQLRAAENGQTPAEGKSDDSEGESQDEGDS